MRILKKSTISTQTKQLLHIFQLKWRYFPSTLSSFCFLVSIILHFCFSHPPPPFLFLSLSLSPALYSYSNLVQSDFLSDSSNLVRTDGPHTNTHIKTHIQTCTLAFSVTQIVLKLVVRHISHHHYLDLIFFPTRTRLPSHCPTSSYGLFMDGLLGDQQVSRAADRCGNNWKCVSFLMPLKIYWYLKTKVMSRVRSEVCSVYCSCF